jgi:putative restriction endonuclease
MRVAPIELKEDPSTMLEFDARVRVAAMAYLAALVDRTGVVHRRELQAFEYEGERIPLIGVQRGIWKPRDWSVALSILTMPDSPYEDRIGDDGYARYQWRGADSDFFDNRALRKAIGSEIPLIWFVGLGASLFEPVFPIWIMGEERSQRQFVVAVDQVMRSYWSAELSSAPPYDPVRRYAEAQVRVRLHQRPFRSRVLIAYATRCAVCGLRHRELLDAAHIKEDANGGEPIVPNGLAMCAIHHRAFDAQFLGVRPDFKIEIKHDLLIEKDGPTLQYALQGLHGSGIGLPSKPSERPNRELLEERHERFLAAG